jgi:hypothetical protein
MPTYLVEVGMADPGAVEVEGAIRMLTSVQSRMAGAVPVETLFAGLSREEGSSSASSTRPASSRRDE